MPSFNNFTTKAKEAIRKAHELAIERGQNHVNSLHLLTSLLTQDDSFVISILDKMEIDTTLLIDNLIEVIEPPENHNTLSPSYQIYLTGDLAQTIENSSKATGFLCRPARRGAHGRRLAHDEVRLAPDRPHPAASRGRAGTDGALRQLPEGREHLLHR